MSPCRNALKKFLQQNGSVYPYRDVTKTRNSVFVSWLLMKRQRYTGPIGTVLGIKMEETEWVALPSNALSTATVTHLVIAEEALPVPADVAAVLEIMEAWGKALDIQWYNRVVDYLGYLVSNGFELNRESIFHHAIEFKVDLMLERHDESLPYAMLMDDWDAYFKHEYRCGKSKRFFDLCQASIDHVDSLLKWVDSIIPLINSPAVVPVSPPSVESMSQY